MTPATSAPAALHRVRAFGSHGGGFIATRYPDEPAIGLEPEWQDVALVLRRAACDAFAEFGDERLARPDAE